MRIALVVSQYNDFVTHRLEAGARARLREAGLGEHAIETFLVPGAYELPQAASRLAHSGAWSAVVCLGCVIRGETPHFQVISDAVANGIMRAAQASGVPIAFGVLTTNTAEEAMARASEGASNKGREAAAAAIDMAELYARLAASTRAGTA
jgi:6,7-dimethyl-8-ribityllumazine synthase